MTAGTFSPQVLISEAGASDAGETETGFWVEGESDEACCPLRDVSPLTNPLGEY